MMLIAGNQLPFLDDEIEEQPAFLQSIEKIAASQKLYFEIWGIDPESVPPTKAVDTDLAPRLTQVSPASVLSQESWSKTSNSFGVCFSRPIGRRAAYCNVRMPTRNRKDGVFFFTFDTRMYVWPKSKMDTAVIQMLHVSQLIDDATYASFRAEGFDPLPITAASDRR